MANAKSLVFHAKHEKDTQRKKKFSEEEDDRNKQISGAIYIGQKHLKSIGDPQRVKVTIEPA